MHSEECERWLSTRRRAERGHGSLYSSECTVCKGEGSAVNDQSDAGRKGNRQTGTCTCSHLSFKNMDIHVEYAHVYTNHSKEYMHTHRYTVHILHASGHDSAQSCGCMHELHCHMGPFACSDAAGKLGQ